MANIYSFIRSKTLSGAVYGTHVLLTVTLFVINIITCNLEMSQLRLKTTELENLGGLEFEPKLEII